MLTPNPKDRPSIFEIEEILSNYDKIDQLKLNVSQYILIWKEICRGSQKDWQLNWEIIKTEESNGGYSRPWWFWWFSNR